jgi:hypothetical protein
MGMLAAGLTTILRAFASENLAVRRHENICPTLYIHTGFRAMTSAHAL